MDYQVRSIKGSSHRGITLVELIVVVGIIMLLTAVSITVYGSFKAHENLEIATMGVVGALRHAQANAESGKADSPWGVALLTSSVVVFKGGVYALRDISADQKLDLPSGVFAGGLSEIVFEKVTGNTGGAGSVTLTNSFGVRNIIINAKGTITY
ncbi:MAG: hypothetical protein A2845_02630 [Candidatus Lloydbacteria bacterium RIFCSPHIGHO2_01_FULL_49_22]|uniref:General secretion pathway GspH domain-containing protein n=1 Tax=Candidatus Lloydbacteria bacterium RIFCSPHIGHO2_01_FULL_49_22 TaxID=1798658 RepID=A0A1G2CVE4_9BACT|nr:MAG: hypothetical protein A2845_02630 [Candidatus Lloydbacteria bacterium RIFCSPHIGHO2_01_FULL_49_22]OGZ10344.1 MAG: hypothetical protein A3C14_02330 [Candidatus Lloydbacteria bacterium RIFCSPHIGHO2_02_FULL_50_18]